MIQAHPSFGVGVGQYAEQSSSYSAPGLLQMFSSTTENAHNNFLQVLGELGIIGFAGFLWLLWATAKQTAAGLRRASNPQRQAVAAGVVAFVLTWFSGHPLLVDEPAFSFWLLLGTAAGWAPAAPRVGRWRGATIIAVALALALSIPVRARQQVAAADLEHQGIGLSSWHHGDDGRRYRLAGSWSTLFVPSDARAITIPLRSAQPGTELMVSLRLNGRPADAVRLTGERWYDLHLILPSKRDAPRFSRLELRVDDDSATDASRLMIGKVEWR
jgi:hypothetical protein